VTIEKRPSGMTVVATPPGGRRKRRGPRAARRPIATLECPKYPEYGHGLSLCVLDVGSNGARTKRLLHSAFMWKLQAKPGCRLIPE
jgi:hypothetical protein